MLPYAATGETATAQLHSVALFPLYAAGRSQIPEKEKEKEKATDKIVLLTLADYVIVEDFVSSRKERVARMRRRDK